MPNDASFPSNILSATGTLDPSLALTELHLPDGRILRVPTALLETATAQPITTPDTIAGDTVIPLIEERLEVGKRTVETGRILLHKTVQEFETQLDEPLAVRTYDIEHISLNQPIDAPPAVRTEGETTIYPIIEERLILTKQLFLKEEVRVTRRDTERRDTQTVVLRREHLVVERKTSAS